MIELKPITGNQPLHEAFGINEEQAAAIKKEVLYEFMRTHTWEDCIGHAVKEEDTDLEVAFKILIIGELIGLAKRLKEE